MSDSIDEVERSRKRRRTQTVTKDLPLSLTATVSPPPLRRKIVIGPQEASNVISGILQGPRAIKSPFQLTWIRDLPGSANVDAITLNHLLGDPLISECWEFNYMHNVDFLMKHFDPDVKDLVKVHIVHGFWRDEDASKHKIKVGN